MDAARAEIGVFGGSGLYRLLADVSYLAIETPYGPAPMMQTVTRDRRSIASFLREGLATLLVNSGGDH